MPMKRRSSYWLSKASMMIFVESPSSSTVQFGSFIGLPAAS